MLPISGTCVEATLMARRDGKWVEAESDISLELVTNSDQSLSATIVSAKPAEALGIRFNAPKAKNSLQFGYQSWSFSGAVKIPDDYPRHDDGEVFGDLVASGDVLDEVAGISYAMAGFDGEYDKNQKVLVIGAQTAQIATTVIGSRQSDDGAEVTIVYGAGREELPESSDGKVRSEHLFFGLSDSLNTCLDQYRDTMAKETTTAQREPQKPPAGWYSWNEKFSNIDEDYILANADVIADKLKPHGLDLVEIDDGWEQSWGDWQANDKFGSGMDALADNVTKKGLKIGVWMAPFLVDVESKTAKSISMDWVVHDTDGKPIQHQPQGLAKHFYILDGTHPEAMTVVTDHVKEMAKSGYSFFKFDYLYAGAIPGVRYDKKATGNQALVQGFAALRKATGEDSVINACGTPILPVLGWADSLRVGTDTAFFAATLTWTTVEATARSFATRGFLAPLVWVDNDQVQVREPYSIDEAKAAAVVAAMAGPAYSLGDDLTKLPADRLAIALDAEILALANADLPARPQNPLENPVAEIVTNPVVDFLLSAGKDEGAAKPPSNYSSNGSPDYDISISWRGDHNVSMEKSQ